jgi:hypothetical protein
MRTFYAIEYEGSTPLKIHEISVPDVREPGFYRQTVSIEAFRQKNVDFVAGAYRNKHVLVRSRWFSVKDEQDFKHHMTFEARAFDPDQGPCALAPRTKHESVWAFYEVIGYRKTVPNINYWQTRA